MGPSPATTTSTKAEEICRVLSDPVVDLWKLRELALTEGGLVNDSLRKVAWPKLVGLNPEIHTLSATVGQPSHPTSDVTIPPSLDSEQIDRDVARVTWHLLTGNQRSRNFQMKNKHRKRIGTLLKKKQRRLGDFLNLALVQSYGEDDEGGEEGRLRYYQGYHDIASIVLSALGGATSVQTTLPIEGGSVGSGKVRSFDADVQEAHTAASSMGLTLACQVLLQISRSHHRDAMRANFQQLNAALRLIIMPLTAAFDSEVHSHLFDCEMEPFFALSWIITWFSHDVRDTSQVKRLFDFFISSHPLMSIYMSVAMMIHPLNRIEILGADCDFACVHHVLADLPKNSSNVGWKYTPGDGGCTGYVSGDDDDASATEGSLLDQSCDEPEEESNNPRNARVPFQDLIDLSISLMHKIPPRNLINLAQRYHTEITLRPLMAEASAIALLQPPPSRCLASYADSDWVLKQKLREEHGLKLNRHQRKNRYKLVNTGVEYHGDDEVMNSFEVSSCKQPATMPKKSHPKAIIASGTGPDGLAEERKLKKRRRIMVRSVAIVLLSVFAAMAKNYFMSTTEDKLHEIDLPQRQDSTRGVALEEDISTTLSDATSDSKAGQEDTCSENVVLNQEESESLNLAGESSFGQAHENSLDFPKEVTEEAVANEKGGTVCGDDEAEKVETKSSPIKARKESIQAENESELSPIEAKEVSIFQKKENCGPSSSEPFNIIADYVLTTFFTIEPYLQVFLFHAIKILQLGRNHAEWAMSKVAPVAELGLIFELEDGASTGWEEVAQQTWNKRALMYQNQLKKVAKFTSVVLRKGAKSTRELTQGLAKEINKDLTRRIFKKAEAPA